MSKYYLCLELGGTNLRYGIVSQEMEVVMFRKISTAVLSEAENKIGFLSDLLERLMQQVGRENVLAITMALASLMDKERTIVYSSPMVKGFNNIPLVEELEQIFHIPVILEKDVNILLLYEISQLKMDTEGIITGVFIGTGLGNAMCINGRVYKGNSGAACELGHIPVSGLQQMCGCGKKGCIELLACGNILNRMAKETYGCDVREIFTLHRDKPNVMDVIYHCALAVASEITLLDPICVILGGGVVEMQDFPLQYFKECVRENLRTPNPRNLVDLRLASGDERAGVLGSAIHAQQMLNGACKRNML